MLLPQAPSTAAPESSPALQQQIVGMSALYLAVSQRVWANCIWTLKTEADRKLCTDVQMYLNSIPLSPKLSRYVTITDRCLIKQQQSFVSVAGPADGHSCH